MTEYLTSSVDQDKMTAVTATATAFARKASLRKSMLRTLRAIPSSELERQSQAVHDILSQQPFYRQAKSIGCYLSMSKGELQTNSIISDILRRETPLFTPYIPTSPESEMQMLRLYSTGDLDKCPLDKWGILDPGEKRRDVREDIMREDAMHISAPTPPLDLILIPGVAFDSECNRLGRGKAFYDRFLLSYTSTKPKPLLVALALEPQILTGDEKVPTTEMDFRLDAVISPRGIVWRSER